MKLNPLSAALVGAGVAVVGTAGAIDLPRWLRSDASAVVIVTPALGPSFGIAPAGTWT